MERVSISLIACYINIVYTISESGLIIHGINWYNINLTFLIIIIIVKLKRIILLTW